MSDSAVHGGTHFACFATDLSKQVAAAMAIGRKQSVQDKDESHPVDLKPDPWDSPPLHPSSPPAMECSSLPRGFVVRSLTPEKENSALTLDCVNTPKRQKTEDLSEGLKMNCSEMKGGSTFMQLYEAPSGYDTPGVEEEQLTAPELDEAIVRERSWM